MNNAGNRNGAPLLAYVLVALLGMALTLGAIVVIKTLGRSDGENPQATVTTSASPLPPSSSAKPRATQSLVNEYCSDISGLCFNYPYDWYVAVHKTPSGDEAKPWARYDSNFTRVSGNPVMELHDVVEGIGSGCSEDYDLLPPLHVIEAVPTALETTDHDGNTLETYAVKVINEHTQPDGSVGYGASMYLTQLKALFSPGDVGMTCELMRPDIMSVGGNVLSLAVLGPSLPSLTPYDSYDEAVQAFNNPAYDGVWETITSVHIK